MSLRLQQRPEETAHIAWIEFEDCAESAGGDAGAGPDLIKEAGLGEGILAIEVSFAQQAKPSRVEAIELAQGRNMAGQSGIGSHASRISKLVAFGN